MTRAAGTAGILLLFSAMPLPGMAGDGQPIRFARGANSAEVSGAVVRGEVARYTVNARQGQTLHLGITALEDNAVFQLYPPGRDAAALPGAAEGEDAIRWSGRLPRSGDYRIVVGATRGNATYRLSVRID